MSTPTSTRSQGDGFSPAQLHDYAERLRTELLRVPDVNKVDFIGDQEQRVYVEIANAQLAKLGLTPQQIADAVERTEFRGGRGHLHTRPTIGCTCDRADSSGRGQAGRHADPGQRPHVRLGDIATITRGYTDPPDADTCASTGQTCSASA